MFVMFKILQHKCSPIANFRYYNFSYFCFRATNLFCTRSFTNEEHTLKNCDLDHKKSNNMVKVLNVAEKNDAAKNIAKVLSRGGANTRNGFSQYNKIYEFPYHLQGQQVHMIFTSVSGHLLNHEFVGSYKHWTSCSPLDLFTAPVVKDVKEENMDKIRKTLEREVRGASKLIIWTDCDREGENIGFEIISVCQAIKPNISVHRAQFSEITPISVNRAINNLGVPDHRQSKAVDVRSELDLRIGAAFTRFQTLRLQKLFPASLSNTLISYGSCQFPTLGFVVERYKAIQEFIPENFWKIKALHDHPEGTVEFAWSRGRVFDELVCDVLLDTCLEDPVATVTSVNARPKSKWRPLPLDTVEFEKLASRKLRLSAKDAMKIAEKLYTSGIISYPRTETNFFPKELNLIPLVEIQTVDPNWGEFATRILQQPRGPNPRQGKKSDEAHPPIHPIKHAPSLTGDEQRIYELITRSFLACLSDDARGHETVVEITVAAESFRASGLIILEKNYLEVYPYEKWTDKPLPHYEMGSQFTSHLEKVGGQTSPPSLLTEADLIALMEKHGIGTDATHAEHIETIKARSYVGLQDNRFVPGTLGMGLVNGYDDMGFQMSKPNLRAALEADLKLICEGRKEPGVVLQEQINIYKTVFEEAIKHVSKLDLSVGALLQETPAIRASEVSLPNFTFVGTCGSCGDKIVVKPRKNGVGFYLSCLGFPNCRASLWFPESVTSVAVTNETCHQCPGSPHVLELTFKPRSFAPLLPDKIKTCVFGCDTYVLDALQIRPLPKSIRATTAAVAPSNVAVHNVTNSARDNFRGGRSINGQSTGGSTAGAARESRIPPAATTDDMDWGDDDFGNDDEDFGGGRPSYDSAYNTVRRASIQVNNSLIVRNPLNRNINDSLVETASSGYLSQGHSSSHDTNNSNQNAIVCGCGEDALLLTVRKEGANTGRQFYKCPKPMGSCCNFFQWADASSATASGSRSTTFGSASQTSGVGGSLNTANFTPTLNSSGLSDECEVLCVCGLLAVKRTVQKDGPNKGREFYVCRKDRSEQCNFFKWAEEANAGGSGDRSGYRRVNGLSGNTSIRGRGGGARGAVKRNAVKPSVGASTKKRKCGICGQEGHNRKSCPMANL